MTGTGPYAIANWKRRNLPTSVNDFSSYNLLSNTHKITTNIFNRGRACAEEHPSKHSVHARAFYGRHKPYAQLMNSEGLELVFNFE